MLGQECQWGYFISVNIRQFVLTLGQLILLLSVLLFHTTAHLVSVQVMHQTVINFAVLDKSLVRKEVTSMDSYLTLWYSYSYTAVVTSVVSVSLDVSISFLSLSTYKYTQESMLLCYLGYVRNHVAPEILYIHFSNLVNVNQHTCRTSVIRSQTLFWKLVS